jgi:hypothetical protein
LLHLVHHYLEISTKLGKVHCCDMHGRNGHAVFCCRMCCAQWGNLIPSSLSNPQPT